MYKVYIKSCPKKNKKYLTNVLNHYTNIDYNICESYVESILKGESIVFTFGKEDIKKEFISSVKELKCKIL